MLLNGLIDFDNPVVKEVWDAVESMYMLKTEVFEDLQALKNDSALGGKVSRQFGKQGQRLVYMVVVGRMLGDAECILLSGMIKCVRGEM